MKKLPITLTVITKNEEERIAECLNSVKDFVDEIIVVDSGSTDQTVDIAEKCGAKVFFREWEGYGSQKIYAETLAKHKWILNLDADEFFSQELKEEVRDLFKKGEPKKPAYQIVLSLVFLWHKNPSKRVREGMVTRLYNKEKAGFRDSRVHDSVVLKDKNEGVGMLSQTAYHRCFKSFHHWIEKTNAYTDEQTQDWIERGRKEPSSARIVFEPIMAFFKSLFVKRYIFLGVDGVLASYLYATAKLLRLVKVREAYRRKKK